MTYFQFLLQFLGIPLAVLLLVTLIDRRRVNNSPFILKNSTVILAIGLHVLLAVAYTTPWDNYLVATGVWYYNPELISGIVLGWVPLEEYTFFVLETIFTGLWWWFLARRIAPETEFLPNQNYRLISTVALGMAWLFSLLILFSGWEPGTYLALILAWALPPIMLQLAFGADLLWHFRKMVALTILPIFLYISASDSLAIAAGTWTIDPAQSTRIFLGALPVEEAVFFLATVTLIGFGLTLSLARASQERLRSWIKRIREINTYSFQKGTIKE